jgi:tetratricopeptide (TPR) repeat protein
MTQRGHFYNDAVQSLYELGKYEEGVARCQELLAELRTRDPKHPDVRNLLREIAVFQKASGKLENAIATMHEVLAYDLAAEGELSQHSIGSVSYLAYLNLLARHYELAEQLIRRGLAIVFQLPKEEQRERHVFLKNLAAIHSQKGQLREAELRLFEAARLVGMEPGWWSPKFGKLYFQLSNIYEQQGKLVAAKRAIRKGLRTLANAERYRFDEMEFGSMHFQLGRLHQLLNEFAEARKSFGASLAVFEHLKPLENPDRIRWETICRGRLAALKEAIAAMP